MQCYAYIRRHFSTQIAEDIVKYTALAPARMRKRLTGARRGIAVTTRHALRRAVSFRE